MQRAIAIRRAIAALLVLAGRAGAQHVVQFIFTSDQHYGITRPAFRGDSNVDAAVVNAALVRQMNAMPNVVLPDDGGVGASRAVGAIDFVVVGGDVANRAEKGVQGATASWREFEHDYVRGLTLRGHDGSPMRLFVVPGNHDLANALGSPAIAARDTTSLAGIYRLMVGARAGGGPFDPMRDVVNTSRAIAGIHFCFLSLWPDSAQRIWLGHDLDTVSVTSPVVLFAHDPPIADARHFTPPTSRDVDGFEGLLRETYKDGVAGRAAGAKGKLSTDAEQRGLSAFVRDHPNIVAYFHGHSNANEFYVWRGPDGDVRLNTFRVDSPMKGASSARDERLVSFQLVSIDTKRRRMTVRECLWNTARDTPVVIGQSTTVSLN